MVFEVASRIRPSFSSMRASGLMWLLSRMPILVWAGSALLGWVAGELIATEPLLTRAGVPRLLAPSGLESQHAPRP